MMLNLLEQRQRVKRLVKEWDILTEPLTTAIVYHPGGWEDTIPEELKREVIRQRIEKMVNGGWDEATDAEVLCYLMTASLVQPLSSDWTQIFLYQGAQFMPQVRDAIPNTPKELSDYQKSELSDLKRKIRDSQTRRRKSKKTEGNMPKRKLVLEEHEKSVLVGIMQEGCDPVIRTVEGSLDEALAYIPKFLGEAQEEWAVSPKKPAYVPPVAPKPATTPAAATTPAQKVEDLPLLSRTEKPVVPPEAKVSAEEKAPEAEVEVTEPPAVPAEAEPEPEVPPVEPEAVEPAESGVAGIIRSEAQPTPSTAAKPGEWAYYLQDGRGPFESVQAAMDELGMDKNNRPLHNRWDRLSTALKEKIQRRPKA